LIGYVGTLAARTSWSHDFILWELPFSEGLRLIDYYAWIGSQPRDGIDFRWADDVWALDEELTGGE
jgi:hypothetical protein